jgi:DNA-binding PadR family transcriptional regulator
MSQPSLTLLNEYALTDYHYDILMICEHPTFWKQGSLIHSIQTLYKLRDRGLLSGPETRSPYDKPFELTAEGRQLVNKIERGIHHPKWLSGPKLAVLKRLADGTYLRKTLVQIHGATGPTLIALERARYIYRPVADHFALTDLGREALADWDHSQIEPLPAGSFSYGGRA